MSPREVIARAIQKSDMDDEEPWDKCPESVQAIYLEFADAVIDALDEMEVTEDMMLMYHSCATPPHDPIGEVMSIWRAMVGAMRNE